ncbi:Cd(II)/Pb(II)-responsive transcriptional regulator [Massilia sp. erpn]|uniref:Cd(II)/Pb(II)-responsive transcriptional regulator n=1 Tax=Massilia sp. erpn TaxID=2738142 RepID=UPI0021020CAA|nr:Cd(II)/Pb(II)-responsive transcriptional regulator [Massilia sp. erpn]UTY59415.1 Cd(II)/Pb(II)-responsive transcriptional regulator [Massilia sp. erpn]
MEKTFKIGELALQTGCAVETIRYYEREGLLPPPARSSANYRLYDEAHAERLMFIRRCRSLDMGLAEIQQLLALRATPDGSCGGVNALLDRHIDGLAQRIAELESLRRQLLDLRSLCHETLTAKECGILHGIAAGSA